MPSLQQRETHSTGSDRRPTEKLRRSRPGATPSFFSHKRIITMHTTTRHILSSTAACHHPTASGFVRGPSSAAAGPLAVVRNMILRSLATCAFAGWGSNWIDTGRSTGSGRSEEVVGRLIRELPALRTDPLLLPRSAPRLGHAIPEAAAAESQISPPDSIRRECEPQLSAAGCRAIDLYQFLNFHWPDQRRYALRGLLSACCTHREAGRRQAFALRRDLL